MTATFERVAAWCAVVTAVASVLFTIAFAVVVQEGERWAAWTSWSALLAGSLVSLVVLVALHGRCAAPEPQFALLALLLGAAGAIGAAVHAAFELGVLANPVAGTGDLPNAIDPRGFMTFGVSGLALGLFAWLLHHDGASARTAGRLAGTAAVLLVVVYVGRLTVLDPKTNVIRVAALASGLALVPAFYVEVGRLLLRGGSMPVATAAERVEVPA